LRGCSTSRRTCSSATRAALRQLYDHEPLIEHKRTHWRDGLREAQNLETEVYAELKAGGPLPDVPLMVLTATGRNPYWAKFMTEDQMRTAHEGIVALHKAMGGEHRLVEGAPHQYMHVDQPESIAAAVNAVVAHAKGPLPGKAAGPAGEISDGQRPADDRAGGARTGVLDPQHPGTVARLR